MDSTQFYGVHTALITPFTENKIAWESLAQIIEKQVEAGVDGLVAVGTTGESPTLDHDEHMEVIRFVIEKTAGRVPVMAGTGANSTKEAVELTKLATQAGADAILQVAPYYNKPSQEGLYQHFSAVARATDKPILLYSIPGRCGIEIGVGTVLRLHESFPHIIGIKEAGGSCDRVAQLRQALNPDFVILSGDDGLALPFMSIGAQGVISVASNLVPAQVREMVGLAADNDFAAASQVNARLFPVFSALLSLGPNPVPVKQAMHLAGLIGSAEVRLPLATLGEADAQELRRILVEAQIINS